MTDREYLELAAKAAGYVIVWGDKYKLGDDEIDCTDIPYIRSGQPDEGDIFWNPLTDDGDALRLAVKLEIDLAFEGSPDIVWADDNWSEPAGVDRQAATRRAIVRAAAELGRQKRAPDTQGSTVMQPIRRNPAHAGNLTLHAALQDVQRFVL